jgi:3-keto-5-aminohexanoate cleavage enzyme
VNPPAKIEALLARMRELGVRPEFEVFELGMVNTLWSLAERDLVPGRPVVNVLLGSMGSAPAFVGDLAHIVGRLPGGTEWAAAGIGIFQRPMVIAAAIMGGNVRTGLEDNPSVPDRHTTNVDAVELAVQAAELAGRPVAAVAETRRRFGLPAR